MTTQDLTDLKQLFEFAILTGDKPPLTKSDCEMVVAAVDRVLKEQQWVIWKSGDPMPAHGDYLVHCEWHRNGSHVRSRSIRHTADGQFAWRDVVAFWPIALPNPPKVSV